MLDISKLLEQTREKLENRKWYQPQTLFEPDLTLIKTHKRCPLCFNKLKITREGAGYCKSKKHKPFFVQAIKLK